MAPKKRKNQKQIKQIITSKNPVSKWVVHYGGLKGAGKGNVAHNNLFVVVAEKIPYEFFSPVKAKMRAKGFSLAGVYVCHDSMGSPRYIGRGGNVFNRIAARFKAHSDELVYFSLYIVEEKNHEREIETLLIRAAAFNLEFNDKKKRASISAGNILDYEAGTHFFSRRRKRGRKKH